MCLSDGRRDRATNTLLVLTTILAAVLVSVWSTPVARASTGAKAPGCEQQTAQTASGSPPRSAVKASGGTSAVVLKPADENSKIVERNFGEHRHVYHRTLVFETSRPLAIEPNQVSVGVPGGLIDPHTTEVFPVEHSQVTFGATIDPSANRLVVKLCINPSGPEFVEPGRYVGTILISGREIAPTQIPVTLTVKSSKWWLAWLLAAVGVATGVGIKLLARHINSEPRLSHPRLAWLIVIGVGGAVLVVKKLYYDPATFGNGDFYAILIGSVGAALGGAGVTSLVKEKPSTD